MDDISPFLDPLATLDGQRGNHHIRNGISEFILLRVYRKAGNIGLYYRMSDDLQ